MRVAVFTCNMIRHKFVANTLARAADETLVISECKTNDAADLDSDQQPPPFFHDHFHQRFVTEKKIFGGHDAFRAPTVPLMYKEANLAYTREVVKNFSPDMAVVFGASLIHKSLLSVLPKNRTINLHLGLSPYYRVSGTNFWPFVNRELEYVGSTIHHLNTGIDSGDIIAHVRPKIEVGDDVHTLGCKVIKESSSCLVEALKLLGTGGKLKKVKQWKDPHGRFYRKKDFTKDTLLTYQKNMKEGLIESYLKGPKKEITLISLT